MPKGRKGVDADAPPGGTGQLATGDNVGQQDSTAAPAHWPHPSPPHTPNLQNGSLSYADKPCKGHEYRVFGLFRLSAGTSHLLYRRACPRPPLPPGRNIGRFNY